MDGYEILHPIGSGSFGKVFRARHKPSNKIVALKKISKVIKLKHVQLRGRHIVLVVKSKGPLFVFFDHQYYMLTQLRRVAKTVSFCKKSKVHDQCLWGVLSKI